MAPNLRPSPPPARWSLATASVYTTHTALTSSFQVCSLQLRVSRPNRWRGSRHPAVATQPTEDEHALSRTSIPGLLFPAMLLWACILPSRLSRRGNLALLLYRSLASCRGSGTPTRSGVTTRSERKQSMQESRIFLRDDNTFVLIPVYTYGSSLTVAAYGQYLRDELEGELTHTINDHRQLTPVWCFQSRESPRCWPRGTV